MADPISTPNTTTPTSPASGGLNYDEYQRKIQEAAARTRDVGNLTVPDSLRRAPEHIQAVGASRRIAEGLVESYEQKGQDLRKQAERAASALEMVGSSTIQSIKNMEALQGRVRTIAEGASSAWDAAAEKADEYVQAARSRVGSVLSKLDELHAEMTTSRDFSKAHAMQASVQAVTGSMRDEERNILQNYGANSAEYTQFKMSKNQALATVQSNIHSSYAQLEDQQKTAYLNAVNDAYTKSNMYVGFQEQQHVEMLKYRDTNKNAYALDAAKLDVSIEQMKTAGMENLANWLIETPTFSLDVMPLATMLADLGAQGQSLYDTHKYMKRASKGKSFGSMMLPALATGIGTAIAGPIGALAGGALANAATGAGKAATSGISNLLYRPRSTGLSASQRQFNYQVGG